MGSLAQLNLQNFLNEIQDRGLHLNHLTHLGFNLRLVKPCAERCLQDSVKGRVHVKPGELIAVAAGHPM